MTDGIKLREEIESKGIKLNFFYEMTGISRERARTIFAGGDCKASEIVSISVFLGLSNQKQKEIFFAKGVN